MADLVRYDVGRGIATVTLDSPDDRNALSSELSEQLLDRLRAGAADDAVRAVVLTATGTTFCSGAKLGQGSGPIDALRGVLEQLWTFPKTTVAAVNGHARAGGVGLVAATDIAISAAEATFAFTEVRIGVAPAMIAVVCQRRMHPRPLRRYMLTGETFAADAAVAAGLLTAAVPRDELGVAVDAILDSVRLTERHAVAATKELLLELPDMAVDAGLRHAQRIAARLFDSPEAAEGMLAFRERRPPAWAAD
jgi:enoyl-CoA hydratase/carnithine racemase